MGQLQSNANNAQPNPDEEGTTWWCRLLARVAGVLGGLVMLITGVFTIIHLSALCIISGILQIFIGFLVLIFEAPVCCQFVEITKPIGAFAERRTFFQKAIIFGILAIPPLAMCFGLSTLFGCGLVFASGVLYGLMALGKKADRQDMMASAAVEQPPPVTSAKMEEANVGLMESDPAYNQFK